MPSSLTVRTLTIQSATETSQYWVMALVDMPDDSTCDPTSYRVISGSPDSLLFPWTVGSSSTTVTFVTCLVPSSSGQYANIFIVQQDDNHRGAVTYQNPTQK